MKKVVTYLLAAILIIGSVLFSESSRVMADDAEDYSADSKWIKDYEYYLRSNTGEIVLTKYKGTDTDVFVYRKAKVGGRTYKTVLSTHDGLSIWAKTDVVRIDFEDGFEFPENCAYLFYYCIKLKSIDLRGVDTSKAVTMEGMFESCYSLKVLDLSSFNTKNVRNMDDMFCGDDNLLNIDVSSFDTRNVTTADRMFASCNHLKRLDLSNFDLRNLKTTSHSDIFAAAFYGAICDGTFEYIYTPINVNASVDLDYNFYDIKCNKCRYIPKNNKTTKKLYSKMVGWEKIERDNGTPLYRYSPFDN